ncbi:hypothetical protein HDU67_001110 [Dinochytrium kinnereticum]|nr:hypothetical protein HDU67_001110 [Dinochytrium kinnereticum]
MPPKPANASPQATPKDPPQPATPRRPAQKLHPFLELMGQVIPYVLIFGTIAYKYFVSSGPALPSSCKAVGMQCPSFGKASGYAHPQFKSLVDVFMGNFKKGDEVGASFTAYVDGKLVAELYGGHFDDTYTQKYDRDALQLVFSSSKAVTGIAVTYMVDQGLLSFDDKVSKYWPEFAEGGKENVTVRDLMTHRAGVAALDAERVPDADMLGDLDGVAERIAGQLHGFGGERVQAYHAVTRGWFVNEVVRRAHPKKKSVGAVIREDIMPLISDPKDPHSPFEFYFGLPEDLHHRVSPLSGYPLAVTAFKIITPAWIQQSLGLEPIPANLLNSFLQTKTVSHKALFKSLPKTNGQLWPFSYNDERLWRSENPSFSGMTNARTLARLAAFLAANGTLDGKTLISKETLETATVPLGPVMDAIIQRKIDFVTAGWGRLHNFITPNLTWIGWAGAGGSMIWWNTEHNIAFSYVMNFCHYSSVGDKRSHKLMRELSSLVTKIHATGNPVADVDGDVFSFDSARRQRNINKEGPLSFLNAESVDWSLEQGERDDAEL